MSDPRPLTTEPLALDLVNTEWIEDGRRRDLLSDVAGLRVWLATADLAGERADGDVLAAVREARAALRRLLEDRDDADARADVNRVLDRGRLAERLGPDGPEQALEVDAVHRVAWLAARNLLDLLRERPDRVRACGNPDCILHFYDVSRAGRRQWCSMAGCGNRAKARRHYARHRGTVQ